MKRNRLVSFGALTLILLATVVAAQDATGRAGIEIQVSSKGKAVVGARVLLRYREAPTGSFAALTDSQGRAAFVNLATGAWSIDVSHPEFLSYVAAVILEPGKKASETTSFLQATGAGRQPIRVKYAKASGPRGTPIEAPAPPPRAEPVPTPAAPAPEPPAPEPEPVELREPDIPAPTVEPEPQMPAAPEPTPEPPPAELREPDIPAPEPVPEPGPEPGPSAPEAELPEPEAPEVAAPTEPVAPPPPAEVAEAQAEVVMPEPELPEPQAPEAVRPAEPVEPPPPTEEAEAQAEVVMPEPELPEPQASEAVESPGPETPPAPAPAATVEPTSEPESVQAPAEAPIVETPPSPEPATAVEAEAALEPRPEPPTEPQPTPEPPPAPAPPSPAEPQTPEPEPMPEPVPPAVEPELPEPEVEAVPGPETPPEEPAVELTPEPTAPPVAQPELEAAPEATPEAAPPPTPAPAPRTPSPSLRAYRDRSCPECKPGEWSAASVEFAAAAGPGDSCPADALEAAKRAAHLIARAPVGSLAGFAGPAIGGVSPTAIELLSSEARSSIGEALNWTSGACRVLAISIPHGARFAGFRYEAADDSGQADCVGERDCPIGDSRFLGNPGIERGQEVTIVYSVFENRATDRQRRVRLTAYFVPASGWSP